MGYNRRERSLQICIIGVLKFQQKPEVSVSLLTKMRGLYVFCQRELFPCVDQNYGVVPTRFRKLLFVFELVCVWDHLPCPQLRLVGRTLAHRNCRARSFFGQDG